MTINPNHWTYRLDQELPGRSIDIPVSPLVALDLTGFTAKLVFTHPDYPNRILGEWDQNITLDDALPNVVIASFATTPPWSTIVTAWGKVLRERGVTFLWKLVLTRTGDSAPWPYEEPLPVGEVTILPALAA